MFVSEEQVEKIRYALRHEDSPSLARRRKMMLLSAVGLVDFAIISLYQTGVIRHLPDLAYEVFDSDEVNASAKAYKQGLPDGTTGAMMYATTMALASAGGSKKAGRSKWLSLLTGATAVAGTLGALDYLYDMSFRKKKICPYCITGALVNLSLLPLALSDIKDDFWKSRGIARSQGGLLRG